MTVWVKEIYFIDPYRDLPQFSFQGSLNLSRGDDTVLFKCNGVEFPGMLLQELFPESSEGSVVKHG